jgi:hypothetical protein
MEIYFELGSTETTITQYVVELFVQSGQLVPYNNGECLGNSGCNFAFSNYQNGIENCISGTATNYYAHDHNMDDIFASKDKPVVHDPGNYYVMLFTSVSPTNPDGNSGFLACPQNIYFKDLGCPIPECPTGYYPRPYHCKFEDSRLTNTTLIIEKLPGEDMGLRITIDEHFDFKLGDSAVVKVVDRFTKKQVAIKGEFTVKEIKNGQVSRLLTSNKQQFNPENMDYTYQELHSYPRNPYTTQIDHPHFHSNRKLIASALPDPPTPESAGQKTVEVRFTPDYCLDISIVLDVYDSINADQKQVIRTLETIYTGAEYCGIAEAKANQAVYSKLTFYTMLAGPLVAIVMPSFISKF